MFPMRKANVEVIFHLCFILLLQNEAEVGQAIRESGVPRSDLWLTSKVQTC